MPSRLFVALIVLVAAPLIVLGWALAMMVRAEQDEARRSLESVLAQQLVTAGDQAQQLLQSYRDDWLDGCVAAPDVQQWVSRVRRRDPRVQLAFLTDPQGRVLYPAVPERIDARSVTEFLSIDELIQGRPRGVEDAWTVTRDEHTAWWMPWYRGQGLQLVLWIDRPDGSAVGILLNRAAWLARLIGQLPDSTPLDARITRTPDASRTDDAVRMRISLVDASDSVLYRWGSADQASAADDDDQATWHRWAEVAMRPPLSAWRLRYEGDAPLAAPHSANVSLWIGLLGLGTLVVLLGSYVGSSLRREMRLARQHVSFAGQVSHELRTPLTNIRLYAELAEQDIDALPPGATREKLQRRLDVIGQETRRLGQLCSGILDLVRRPSASAQRPTEPVDPDDCIETLLRQFGPSLVAHGLQVDHRAGVRAELNLDREAMETVLVNLISNVEKYAASGGRLGITTWWQKDWLTVAVEDRGPGIPRRLREKIFRPFFRIDSSIEAPSGTGIGLSIARQSAIRAGGTLQLMTPPHGACFHLRMPAPAVDGGSKLQESEAPPNDESASGTDDSVGGTAPPHQHGSSPASAPPLHPSRGTDW